MDSVRPPGWHVQDWLLCIEALASVTHPDNATPRQRRAWGLVDAIAAACGIDPVEYVFEIDDDWGADTAVPPTGPPPRPSETFTERDWTLLTSALSAFAETVADDGRRRRARQLAAAVERREEAVVDQRASSR